MRCSMIRALDPDQGQTTWHSPRINLSRPDRGALGCGLSAQLPWLFKTVSGALGFRAQELCESRGGRPGLPVPNSPYGLCGRKATLNSNIGVVGSLGCALA